MRRLLRIFALLTVASMLLVWIAGCEEEEEKEKLPVPEAKTASIAEGAEVAGNVTIQVTFSRKVDDGNITISVSGATGNVTWDPSGKIATWTPSPAIPAGAHTLTVTGTAADGQALKEDKTVNFKAIAPDTTPPKIDDGASDPKNGGTGIDPAKYKESIKVAFSEAVDAKISAKDPDFPSSEELSADGKVLTIKFLKFNLANETTYKIKITATDKAGNKADVEYSFATMKKA